MNVWNNPLISRALVQLYPRIVQDFVTPCIWKLDSDCIKGFYKKYTSKSHLEIGAGPNPQVPREAHFLDTNLEVLNKIGDTISPTKLHHGSLLQKQDYPSARFDSIACMNVMHCIPETNKWEHLFYNTQTVLNTNGVLFGCFVKNNTPYSKVLNRLGVFHNTHDTLDSVRRLSVPYYKHVYTADVGNCGVFVLKKLTS